MSTYQVRSLEEADQIIKEHERKTKTYYALLRSTKNFGCVDVPACTNDEHEVRFETVGVPYCGVPFFVAGLKILQCQSYKGKGGRRKKEREKKIKIEITGTENGGINETFIEDSFDDDQPTKIINNKKKKKAGRPHQLGCTATIIMKEVIYYPEFQLFDHSRNNRIAHARQLKDALKSKNPVQKDRILYVTVPAASDHYGHYVGMGIIPKNNVSRKVYVKNDFYGHNEPGSSKRVYYPVKQEKISVPHMVTKRLKVEDDDTEGRAKEVREMLQSIMALTYKPGTSIAFQELIKDLLQAKLRYQQTMDSLIVTLPSSSATGTILNVHSSQTASFTPTHQVLTVQPNISKGESNTVTVSTGWQNRVNTSLSSNATVLPGTIVTVTALPIPVTSATNLGTGVVTVSNSGNVQQTSATANGADPNNQETSIIIEAMEAILNSQI